MSHTLRFNPGGHVHCLYTEAIDLHVLGRLQVVRATDIRFCDKFQQWHVRCATTGKLLFTNPSRTTCLQWERDNLQPGTTKTNNT